MAGELHDAHPFLQELIRAIPCALFCTRPVGTDGDWELSYVSERIEAITGCSADRYLHGEHSRLIHPDDLITVQTQRRAAVRARREYAVEYRIITHSGEQRWLAESGRPDGATSGFAGLVAEITARTRTDDISDQRLRAFVESTESIVIYLCPYGEILEFNPAAEMLYGIRRQDVIGKNYFKFFLPEEVQDAVMADMKKVLDGTPTRGFENEVITVDGSRRVLSWYVTRTLDNNGAPSGIVASGHDITARKLAEEALQSSQKMLRLVLDSIPVRVYWKDRELRYLGCNHLFAADVGLQAPEDIVGKNDRELGRHAQADKQEPCDRAVIDSGTPNLNYELLDVAPDGAEVWLTVSKVPLTDLKNNVVGILSTYEDISERCRAQQQAAERNLRLKRLTELSLTLSGDPGEVFRDVARMIGELLAVRIVCLSQIRGDEIHFVSLYIDGKVTLDAGSRPLRTTPCASVAASKELEIFDDVISLFPEADFLREYGTDFYCGFPALDSEGNVAAITCLLDDKPHDFSEEDLGLLRIFGQRIAVEIERQQHIDEQARAKEQMKKLSSALEQTADVVLLTGKDGLIEYGNPAFEAVTGFSYFEAKGKSSSLIKSSRHDLHFYKNLWDTILRGEVFQDVIINRKKNGELYYEEKTITPLKDTKGEITHFISTGKDITERMQTQERLYHLAYHDILTELPNRGLFIDRLPPALARHRNPNRFVAVLFMDLDRFKIINDTLGHDIGDRLLKLLSQRIISCLREGDTVARLAGDEFVILLEEITITNDVEPICRKILESLTQPFQIDGKDLYVTGSIDIALSPSDGSDAATLIRNADIAMYRAKELGRNNYQFYSADMSVRAFERLNLETNLRHALKRDEFLLYYQTQVSPASGRIVGLEALLRWRHHDLGVLLPEQVIPVLEETGLIVPVGEWVLRTAFYQARAWRDMDYAPLRVSVNLSSRQFVAVCLKAVVMDLLAEIGLDSRWVGLEITESLLMKNELRTTQTLQELSAAGVQISIDDFNTGYSSLSYLKRLPIDTLKIDGSFIRDVTTDPDDAAIVAAIIAMAKTLKLDVIAEGVETREQLDFVGGHCVAAQGYLFSEPLSVDAVTALLHDDNGTRGEDWKKWMSRAHRRSLRSCRRLQPAWMHASCRSLHRRVQSHCSLIIALARLSLLVRDALLQIGHLLFQLREFEPALG